MRANCPPEARHHLARKAALSRHSPTDTDAIEAADREARTVTLEDYVKRVVDASPPLTDEQRARIARLLAPAGGDAA